MKNEKIFITGGAGFLGKNLIDRLHKDNEITVYSRDEAKHYYLKKYYPNVNFVVGDIRNKDLLIRKSKGHTVGIFAASLKQIEACNDNYEEASKIHNYLVDTYTKYGYDLHEVPKTSVEERFQFIINHLKS